MSDSTTGVLSPKETIAKAYAAIAEGDGATFIGLLADDVVMTEPEGHPFPGVFRGKDAVVGAFPGILGALGIQGLKVLHLLADGDLVVGMIEITCTSKSGDAVIAPVLEAWTVRNGQIVEAKPYYHCTTTLSKAIAS
jgi:ketosteroid isomerase-like protein